MLILLGKKPSIAIEFKWFRKEISKKDRGSLVKALDRLGVNKAYFICCLPDGVAYKKLPKKFAHEKYVLQEIVVGLDWKSRRKSQRWKEERKKYKV